MQVKLHVVRVHRSENPEKEEIRKNEFPDSGNYLGSTFVRCIVLEE